MIGKELVSNFLFFLKNFDQSQSIIFCAVLFLFFCLFLERRKKRNNDNIVKNNKLLIGLYIDNGHIGF